MTETSNPRTAKVSDRLPPFVRSPGLDHWNRYAAVNDEFVPIHMDDEAGREAGYPSAFGMGNLQWSYLHNMLRAWLGDDGDIERISLQFRAPNIKGQTLTAGAAVTAVREGLGGERMLDLDIWVEDQTGNRMAPGLATVRLYPAG
jgi:acyl dehydratase